jgi:hypothetical protein
MKIVLNGRTAEGCRDGVVAFIEERMKGVVGQRWMARTKTEKAVSEGIERALRTLALDIREAELGK